MKRRSTNSLKQIAKELLKGFSALFLWARVNCWFGTWQLCTGVCVKCFYNAESRHYIYIFENKKYNKIHSQASRGCKPVYNNIYILIKISIRSPKSLEKWRGWPLIKKFRVWNQLLNSIKTSFLVFICFCTGIWRLLSGLFYTFCVS